MGLKFDKSARICASFAGLCGCSFVDAVGLVGQTNRPAKKSGAKFEKNFSDPGIVAIIFPFFPGAIWVQLVQDEP